jgi:integrase
MPQPSPPKLLDQVRSAIRVKHYSIRTEETYVNWIKRFILFHHKRHPQEMNSPEIEQFLTHLAVERNVAASTQNQALAALLFLYQQVLRQPLDYPIDAVRAKKPERLPVVLSQAEVNRLLTHLPDHHRLMARLLYGSGLRLREGLRLRVKDIDFKQSRPRSKQPISTNRWAVIPCATALPPTS